MKFDELGLNSQFVKVFSALGIEEPTTIQEKSIPAILDGQDVMGESSTGSGKTLAFATGVIEHTQPGQGLQSLVLTPTRELAEQVKDSIKTFSYKKDLKVITVYGGVSMGPQIANVRKADVVVATPGRLLDHLRQRTIDLSAIHMLVLDEADRMLDMGFIDDVKSIIQACPVERQTLFFSATLSSQIRALANNYMYEPIEVLATKQVDASKLTQVYYNAHRDTKLTLLVNLLQKEISGLVIVFTNTRRTTDFVVKNLKTNGIDALAIHGGLTQNKRTKSIQMFNDAKFGVLVCTDVAARGLHIDNVSHVYNYEIPADPKDYVHRIGRTARAGDSGKVVNILTSNDHENYRRVVRSYSTYRIDKMDMPQLEGIKIVKVERESARPRRQFGGSRNGDQRGDSRGDRSRSPRGDRFGSSRGDRSESPRRERTGNYRGDRSESPRRERSSESSGERSRPRGNSPRNGSAGRPRRRPEAGVRN